MPEHRDWYRRRLPHFDRPGLIQMVTFCLADAWRHRDPETWKVLSDRERHRCLHDELDQAYGACWLRDPAIATIVADAICYRDPGQYSLIAWVVMPNHVHLLFLQRDGWPLATVIQRLKQFTATQCNRVLGREGRFWLPEYWDRYIRDDRHLQACWNYVEGNPKTAGLVDNPEDWPWGSAYVRSDGPLLEMENGLAVRGPGTDWQSAVQERTGSPRS